MSNEVAVFIDLENLRYGLLNAYGVEPDFTAIVEKARKYGRPSVISRVCGFHRAPLGDHAPAAGRRNRGDQRARQAFLRRAQRAAH